MEEYDKTANVVVPMVILLLIVMCCVTSSIVGSCETQDYNQKVKELTKECRSRCTEGYSVKVKEAFNEIEEFSCECN